MTNDVARLHELIAQCEQQVAQWQHHIATDAAAGRDTSLSQHQLRLWEQRLAQARAELIDLLSRSGDTAGAAAAMSAEQDHRRRLAEDYFDGEDRFATARDAADEVVTYERDAKEPTRKPEPTKKDQLGSKATEAAATAAGVPPALAKKLAKTKLGQKGPWVALMVPVVSFVVLVSMIGGLLVAITGSGGNLWDVDPSATATGTIPSAYLDAYRSAGEEFNVPWTILAAVGARASYHGQINPYQQEVPVYAPGLRRSTGTITAVRAVLDPSASSAATTLATKLKAQALPASVVTVNGDAGDVAAALANGKATPGEAIVVVAGTRNNPAQPQLFAQQLDAAMATLDAATPVYWFTMQNGGALNDELYGAASRWPNLEVLDWAGFAASKGVTAGTGYSWSYSAAEAASLAQYAVDALATAAGGQDSAGMLAAPPPGPGVMAIPEGACPNTQRPIAGPKPGNAAGPLLLLPGRLRLFGTEASVDDLQNICTSVDLLAGRMADVGEELADERGLDLEELVDQAEAGDGNAANVLRRFWADVMDRVGVLGAASGDDCTKTPSRSGMSDQQWTGLAILSIWSCELEGSSISIATAAEKLGGVWSYKTLDQGASVDLALQEALDVAWAWSQWGETACSVNDPTSGVFPLPKAAFTANVPTALAKKNHCDPVANIAAAARAFLATETTPATPAQRSAVDGPWQPLQGGWAALPATLGPATVRDTFAANGPLSSLTDVDTCVAAARGVFAAATTDPADPLVGMTLGEVNAITSGTASSATIAKVDEYLRLLTGKVIVSNCAPDRVVSVRDAWALLMVVANGDNTVALGSVPATATVTGPAPRASIGAALATRIGTVAGQEASTLVTVGQTALVPRLSPVRLVTTTPPLVGGGMFGAGVTTGADLVNYATLLGGLFLGDAATSTGFGMLGGTIPYADLFNAAGQTTGVDPRLLAAVAFIESRFNADANCPIASNPNKAYGIMQFTAATAAGMQPPVDPCDAASSIDGGARYLKKLYDTYQDWPTALVSYNAGGAAAGAYADGGVSGLETYLRTCKYSWCGEAKVRETTNYISTDPGVVSVPNKWLEYQQLFPGSVLSGFQTAVGPDGCPTAPALSQIPGLTTMRRGAEDLSIAELCARAVAQARTPEAAQAIKYALRNLGAPYSQPLRNRDGYYDCSSYVTRAYQSSGIPTAPPGVNAPTTHVLLPWPGYSRVPWSIPVPSLGQAQPGDLILTGEGHVTMLLVDGYIVHTNRTGDVSHVTKLWNVYAVRYVDPDLARMHPYGG